MAQPRNVRVPPSERSAGRARPASVSSQGQLLREEHRRLNEFVRELLSWCSEVDELGCPMFGQFAGRLRELQHLLDEHFAKEEAGGYMEAVLRAVPNLSEQAHRLERQHAELHSSLSELIDRLKTCDPCAHYWGDAVAEVRAFLEVLRHHEQAETDLVQRVFLEDVGVGD